MATANPLKNAKLMLNSLPNAKASLARVMRLYANGSLDAARYRNLIYGFSAYLSYLKQEADLDIEQRLEAIENLLEEEK